MMNNALNITLIKRLHKSNGNTSWSHIPLLLFKQAGGSFLCERNYDLKCLKVWRNIELTARNAIITVEKKSAFYEKENTTKLIVVIAHINQIIAVSENILSITLACYTWCCFNFLFIPLLSFNQCSCLPYLPCTTFPFAESLWRKSTQGWSWRNWCPFR